MRRFELMERRGTEKGVIRGLKEVAFTLAFLVKLPVFILHL